MHVRHGFVLFLLLLASMSAGGRSHAQTSSLHLTDGTLQAQESPQGKSISSSELALPSALLAVSPFLVTPVAVAGQWVPPDTGFARVEALTPLPDTAWEEIPLAFASAVDDSPATLTPSLTKNLQLLISEEDSWRKRLLPCALVGAVAGGLIGYVAHEVGEPCDRELYLACPLAPYASVMAGAGYGSVAGTLIGYIRERR